MKILNYVSLKLIMIAIACSFAASTPLQAGEARLNSASARSGGDARLIVSRVANFGTFNFLNLFVDGVYVANLGYLRSYEAVLPPGRHVLSVTGLGFTAAAGAPIVRQRSINPLMLAGAFAGLIMWFGFVNLQEAWHHTGPGYVRGHDMY